MPFPLIPVLLGGLGYTVYKLINSKPVISANAPTNQAVPQSQSPSYPSPNYRAESPTSGSSNAPVDPIASANQSAGTMAAISAIDPGPKSADVKMVGTPLNLAFSRTAIGQAAAAAKAAENQSAGTMAAISSINPGPAPTPIKPPSVLTGLKVPLKVAPHGDFGISAEDAGAGVGPVEKGIGDMLLQGDNMTAINKYMTSTDAVTANAVALKDDWIRWFNGLSWFDINADSPTYDTARNKRNDFNRANATTMAERAAVEDIIRTGLSSEQMQGEADRRDSKGNLPKEPLIPEKYKLAALVAAGLGAAIIVYKTPEAIAEYEAMKHRS